MARRSRSNLGDFGREFAATYGAFGKVADDVRDARIRSEIAAVDGDYTPRQTEAASGEDALVAGQQALQDRMAAATTPEEAQQAQRDFAPTIEALKARQATPASIVQSIGTGAGFRQQTDPLSATDIQGAKASARADIYSRSGREEDAARVLRNEASRRTLADDAEIRNVMRPRPADALVGSAPGIPEGMAPDGAAIAEADPRRAAVQQGAAGPINAEQDRVAADAYLQRKAPQVINTLLQQGNLEGAKRYRDFIDSEAGRNYTQKWSQGVRKFAIGDHQGALNDWQTLYNSQLYADGHTVKLTNLDDGKVQVDQFDNGGNKLGSKTMPIDALARQAGMALSPERLVEFQAQQEGKRSAEAASLDKGIELENLRQEGRDRQDDRRDERLGRRLDAQASALDRRLAASADKGLTTAQAAKNDAIDAARVQLDGMSPEDVTRKTQSALSSGRANPEYDPALARAAKLAQTRKFGDDPEHDAFSQGKAQQNAQATQRADVVKRFRADPKMQNYVLGPSVVTRTRKDGSTVTGFPVLDRSGKEIGLHY